jgi:hypothetical protein
LIRQRSAQRAGRGAPDTPVVGDVSEGKTSADAPEAKTGTDGDANREKTPSIRRKILSERAKEAGNIYKSWVHVAVKRRSSTDSHTISYIINVHTT